MRIKIQGGTLGSDVICRTCSNGWITNRGLSSERIQCTAGMYTVPVTEPVFQCSAWERAGSTSAKAMEASAWIISTSRPKRVGFTQAAPPLRVTIRAPREKHDDDDPFDE